MPQFEQMDCDSPAVLWPANNDAGEDGQATVSSAEQIYVQWSGKRAEMRDGQGRKVALDATAVVLQDIPLSSILWRGLLTEWNGSDSDDPDNELYEVLMFEHGEGFKLRESQRVIGLKRFRASLPTVVP